MQPYSIRRAAPAVLLALTLAACAAEADSVAQPAGAEMAMAEHSHEETLDVSPDGAPTLTIDVQPDAMSGYNVHAAVTGLELHPDAAGGAHVDGQGHMHLYVDGEKVARVYTPWFHLSGVEPGRHEVSMTLNSNTHAGLAVDGEPIMDQVTIDVPEPSDMSHKHPEPLEAEAEMSVSLEVREDPKSGWNAFVTVGGMTFAPEHASSAPVAGEGHAHLYVDDQKIARLYGESFHFSISEPGVHEVRVSLNSNDHRPYRWDGVLVEATQTVEVAGTPIEPDRVIEIAVLDGAASGPARVEVEAGSVVSLLVSADISDMVHVHAYDVMDAVAPEAPASLTFTADAPGIYEIELENSKIPLFELVVQ